MFDPAQPDADLVRDALGGSREALAELVRRHWDTAVFLAARVLGGAELARDAAQEAALAALTDLERLRSPERFGAWFCGIALNVARRWLRQLRAEVPGGWPDRSSAAPGPAEMAEHADTAARVRGAIAALPGGQRQAVLLFYLQGMSHREVAAELGISLGAVKSRLHQARAALAPVLAPVADAPTRVAERPTPRVAGIPAERIMMVNGTAEWIDASVAEIRRSEDEDVRRRKHVMILRERDGDRRLPVWIGATEAEAMALALESVETPRPFTSRLAASLVAAAGSRVGEVRIARLVDQVFYASVVVDGPDGPREVDARPSDAVNLALVTGAPIRIDAGLFGTEPPAQFARELATYPVATAAIAGEVSERMLAWARWDQPGCQGTS